jgi:hypothetical protein
VGTARAGESERETNAERLLGCLPFCWNRGELGGWDPPWVRCAKERRRGSVSGGRLVEQPQKIPTPWSSIPRAATKRPTGRTGSARTTTSTTPTRHDREEKRKASAERRPRPRQRHGAGGSTREPERRTPDSGGRFYTVPPLNTVVFLFFYNNCLNLD